MFLVIPRVNNTYLFHIFPRVATICASYYFHVKQHLYLFHMILRLNSVYFHKPLEIVMETKIFE